MAMIDEIGDYWDRRPCHIRRSARQIGTREYFDEMEAHNYLIVAKSI
jgi:hypothetical protein